MKIYICRRGQADFVVDAPTVGSAIVRFWLATGELPKPTYRIHHGRRRQSRVVSAAVGYWLLSLEMQPILRGVIEENATTSQYEQFCEHIITAGTLLEK